MLKFSGFESYTFPRYRSLWSFGQRVDISGPNVTVSSTRRLLQTLHQKKPSRAAQHSTCSTKDFRNAEACYPHSKNSSHSQATCKQSKFAVSGNATPATRSVPVISGFAYFLSTSRLEEATQKFNGVESQIRYFLAPG